jgi:hypothetical protein
VGDVEWIRACPYLRQGLRESVQGMSFDVKTGLLKKVALNMRPQSAAFIEWVIGTNRSLLFKSNVLECSCVVFDSRLNR